MDFPEPESEFELELEDLEPELSLLSLFPLLSLLLLSFSADFCSSLDEELSSLVPTAITSSLLSFSTSSSISSRLTSSPFSLVISYVFETFPFLPSFSVFRSEEHTSELQSRFDLVCRLMLEKKKSYTHFT